MKIDRGVFEKGVLKYFLAVKIDIKSQMTSSCLTFDLQYNHRIQRFNIYKVLALVMPMSKYQVSTMKLTEIILFLMKECELQEYQIHVIQMYKFKLPQIHIISIFLSL